MTRLIGLIPARAGSKGIPGKNFRAVWAGKKLWEVQELAARSVLPEIYVSTDEPDVLPEFAEVIQRGPEDSDDEASTAAVVRHAARHLNIGQDDAIVLLSPTFSRRRSEDVRAAIEMYRAHRRSLIGFTRSTEHPYLAVTRNESGMGMFCNPDVNEMYRRQTYPEAWRLTTFLCVVKGSDLEAINAQCFHDGSLWVYVDPEKTHDVDTWEDLDAAREWLSERGLP